LSSVGIETRKLSFAMALCACSPATAYRRNRTGSHEKMNTGVHSGHASGAEFHLFICMMPCG
jgi:hypothetical protein